MKIKKKENINRKFCRNALHINSGEYYFVKLSVLFNLYVYIFLTIDHGSKSLKNI